MGDTNRHSISNSNRHSLSNTRTTNSTSTHPPNRTDSSDDTNSAASDERPPYNDVQVATQVQHPVAGSKDIVPWSSTTSNQRVRRYSHRVLSVPRKFKFRKTNGETMQEVSRFQHRHVQSMPKFFSSWDLAYRTKKGNLVQLFNRSERAAIEDVVNTTMSGNKGRVYLVSFNILADCFVNNPRFDGIYAHCDPRALRWSHRRELLFRHLEQVGADIVCLQEVESSLYDSEILPFMRGVGYDGVMQKKTPKSDGTVVPGNATFFKTDKLECDWVEHKYRALITRFAFKGVAECPPVTVANCHLEGAPWKHHERLCQLKSVEKSLNAKKAEARIVCGDFNAGAASDLCTKHLQVQMGYEPAYDNCSGDATCFLLPNDPFDFNQRDAQVDHIFFSQATVQLLGVLRVFEEGWNRHEIIQGGLPAMHWPSDHLSIGAMFEVSKPTICNMENNAHQENLPLSVQSPEDLKRVWEECVLSAETRQRWEEIDAAAPQKHFDPATKSRTPEEIKLLKEWSASKKAFLEDLSAEERTFFQSYQQMARKVEKLAKQQQHAST